LAKINYSFEKRQRELLKKKQKDMKLAKKRSGHDDTSVDANDRSKSSTQG